MLRPRQSFLTTLYKPASPRPATQPHLNPVELNEFNILISLRRIKNIILPSIPSSPDLSIEIVTIGLLIFEWAGIAQSLKGPATTWSVRGSNSFCAPDQSRQSLVPTQPPVRWVLRILQKKGGPSSTKLPRLRIGGAMPPLCLCAFFLNILISQLA